MIKIDKSEVLRYLGCRGECDPETMKEVDSCIEECARLAAPNFIYKKYLLDDDFSIKDSSIILPGNDIKEHLRGAGEIFLMAATIGFEIDKKIMFYEHTSIHRSVILDACASACVESVCSEAEEQIRDSVSGNYRLTWRFSPGYGDFPISVQKSFINLLEADKRIGLYVTESNILTPRKSVTAVIGAADSKVGKKHDCSSCNMWEGCVFRDGKCNN